jgi:hypothetical protein
VLRVLGGVFLDEECATKNSEVRFAVTLCYSPCDDTPTAATVAVTTGGVYRYIRVPQVGVRKQNRLFLQISSDTPPVVRATVAAVGVSSHGL